MKRFLASVCTLLATMSSALPAGIDTTRSRVSITFRQMGTPIEAQFQRFKANIDYNASRPQAASATVELDTTSLDLHDPDYNKVVLQKEWLDAAHFPTATFNSSAIKSPSADGFTVTGTLKIKGNAMNLDIPVHIKTENGAKVFEGRVPIKRLAFKLGEGEWADTSVVADEVIIALRFVQPQ